MNDGIFSQLKELNHKTISIKEIKIFSSNFI